MSEFCDGKPSNYCECMRFPHLLALHLLRENKVLLDMSYGTYRFFFLFYSLALDFSDWTHSAALMERKQRNQE